MKNIVGKGGSDGGRGGFGGAIARAIRRGGGLVVRLTWTRAARDLWRPCLRRLRWWSERREEATCGAYHQRGGRRLGAGRV